MTQRVQMTHAALNVLMDVVAQIESPQTEDEMVPPPSVAQWQKEP